jgi:hypothetical protein
MAAPETAGLVGSTTVPGIVPFGLCPNGTWPRLAVSKQHQINKGTLRTLQTIRRPTAVVIAPPVRGWPRFEMSSTTLSDIEPRAIDSVCKLWDGSKSQGLCCRQAKSSPWTRARDGCDRCVSETVSANPGGLPVVATLFLLPGDSQSPATRSPLLLQGDRSHAVGLHGQYLPEGREVGRVCCVSEIYKALSASALLVWTQPLFNLNVCHS